MVSDRRVSAGRLVAILALLGAFGPFATDMYLSAFPEMRVDLNADSGEVALTISAYFLGLAVGQLVYGPVSDRFGRRRPLLIGIALYTLTSALCFFLQDVDVFIAMRAVQALGGCCGVILGRAIVRDLFADADVARLYSSLSMASMIPPVVAPVIGVGIIVQFGWRAIFLFLVVLGVICFAAVALGLPDSLDRSRRTTSFNPLSIVRSFAAVLRKRRFLFAAMTTGSAAGVLFAFLTGSSLALIDHFGLGRLAYGLIFSAIILAMIGGAYVNRRLVGRLGADRILRRAFGANLVAGGVLLGTSGSGLAAVLLPLLILIATLGFILPNGAAAAMSAVQENVGTASSLLGGIQFGMGFLASSVVALTQDGTVYPMAATMLGAGAVGAAAWFAETRIGAPAA